MKSVIRRLTTLTALTATALGASFIASTSSAIAQNYGQQNIDSDNAIAIAEPVSNGRFYRLLVLEQLTNQRACFEEEPGSPTVVEPLLLNFDFSGICGRRTDSNGYSVRIGDEDLSRRYRLQITRRGESLVLVALPGVLPGRGGGDLPVLEIGRSNGVANDFVKIELDPGWQLTRRTLNGNAQGHVYLSNNNSLETVAAQSGNPRPVASQPSPSTPAPSTPRPSTPSPSRPSLPTPPGSSPLPRPGGSPLPSPGAAPSPSTPSGNDQSTFYQVIVPSSSPIVRSRVRQVAPDAFTTNVSGRSVIQAGLFQEQSRANQLVSQLSSQGIDSEIVEGRRAAPPPSSSPSAETYYQVIVPEGGSNTRDSRQCNRIGRLPNPGRWSHSDSGRSLPRAKSGPRAAKKAHQRQSPCPNYCGHRYYCSYAFARRTFTLSLYTESASGTAHGGDRSGAWWARSGRSWNWGLA